jgi:hypothetical protein
MILISWHFPWQCDPPMSWLFFIRFCKPGQGHWKVIVRIFGFHLRLFGQD